MSLNFKILRRSFSLRSNVSEKQQNEVSSNFEREPFRTNDTFKLTSSGDGITTYQSQYSSTDCHTKKHTKDTLNRNMEFILPFTYARQCQRSNVVQLLNNKKYDNTIASNTIAIPTISGTLAIDALQEDKKNQKQLLYQQRRLLKNSTEIEFPPSKMSKKQIKLAQEQLKKLSKINIHLHALFAAVENNHVEKAISIIESTDVNVNSLNCDGLSPLDVAVLNNNRPLTKILLQRGAIHGSQYKNADSLGSHLNSLLHDTVNRIRELSCYLKDDLSDGDPEKQIDCLQRRLNGLRHIMLGWVQTTTPHPPFSVLVEVISTNSVVIKIQEPFDGAIATKFKLQWSTGSDFDNIIGEKEILELQSNQGVMSSTVHLNNLNQDQRYFFRASSGNCKGWSIHRPSNPNSVVPSSWRNVENQEYPNDEKLMESLLAKFRLHRAENPFETQVDPPSNREFCTRKATIKQLFSATSKFQKNLKRGIYLACLLYHEGKVLVTNDDILPMIEVSESCPNNLCADCLWLHKLSCNWDMVKSLKNDMERNPTTANQFRLKLLSAICQMQSAIGQKNIGHVYYKPLKDANGTVVLSFVCNIKTSKSISVLNSRWIPLRKIQRKLMPLTEDSNINEIVMSSIQNQIDYDLKSLIKLTKGLYFGYLKMQCSMDQMHIVVPTKTPNVLPHCKIRDNPHICAEEWDIIRRTTVQDSPTEVQKIFLDSLKDAAIQIFEYMDTPSELIPDHKLYNLKVIEFSAEVTFLVICPPVDQSCSAPGQREILLQRGDLISIPIPLFEKNQAYVYRRDVVQSCSRLSLILDWEVTMANHWLREAFSSNETESAKKRINKLGELGADLFNIWKEIRWLVDVMTFARNRCPNVGVSMRTIFGMDALSNQSKITVPCASRERERNLLAPESCGDNAVSIRSPCRASWPNTYRGGLPPIEHSKSDQQLNFITSNMRSKYFNQTCEVDCSRRNSTESTYRHFHASEEAIDVDVKLLPLSKSDDTLSTKPASSPSLYRKRSKTINVNVDSSNRLHYDRTLTVKSSESSNFNNRDNATKDSDTDSSRQFGLI